MQRRSLLALPALVAAGSLMPLSVPQAWAIPDANADGYAWERVTEARARGWNHYRRHRGYDTGPGPVGHFLQPARRWKASFWYPGSLAGRVAPPPNDAPFNTLWIPDGGAPGYRALIQYKDGEAWGRRGISAPAARRLETECDRSILYTDPGALPHLLRHAPEGVVRRNLAVAVPPGRAVATFVRRDRVSLA